MKEPLDEAVMNVAKEFFIKNRESVPYIIAGIAKLAIENISEEEGARYVDLIKSCR